jgi:hypothetical protein
MMKSSRAPSFFRYDLGAVGFDLVERRLGDVEVAALDDVGEVAVEERQQQRADVRAVDVGVRHDDDGVVAQLADVVVVGADAGAERGDQGDDLLAGEHLVDAGLLDVEDLAAQREDRLGLAVASLLGRAAGRVALDDEELGVLGVALLAVGELAGQERPSRMPLRVMVSRALRAAARARAASSARSTISRAERGFSSR